MKPCLEITLIDGAKHYVPIKEDPNHIGKPLNHVEHIGFAVLIAKSGFCLDAKAPQPVIVPPSQIRSVQIIDKK